MERVSRVDAAPQLGPLPSIKGSTVSWEDGANQLGSNVMTYRAPISDMLLSHNHGAGLKAAVEAGHYGDFDADIAAVLEEAGKVRKRRAGAAQPRRRRERHQARPWQGHDRVWLARCLQALDGRRLERGVGAGSLRRSGLPITINAACTEACRMVNAAGRTFSRLTSGANSAASASPASWRGVCNRRCAASASQCAKRSMNASASIGSIGHAN